MPAGVSKRPICRNHGPRERRCELRCSACLGTDRQRLGTSMESKSTLSTATFTFILNRSVLGDVCWGRTSVGFPPAWPRFTVASLAILGTLKNHTVVTISIFVYRRQSRAERGRTKMTLSLLSSQACPSRVLGLMRVTRAALESCIDLGQYLS